MNCGTNFFNNKPESSRALTTLIMSYISSFNIISVAVPEPKIILWFLASAADATEVNPNRIKTLLANGLITFFNYGSLFFKSS